MSIRTRLTLFFTAIVSVLLGLFCGLIYLISSQYLVRDFQARLLAEARTGGHLLVGQQRIGPDLFKLMDKNQLTILPQEELIIYNARNQLIYESGTDYLTVTPLRLEQVRQQQTLYWREANRVVVGILFVDHQVPFVIFASAVDTYGQRTTRRLAAILALGWLLMSGLTLVTGRFFATRTLRPVNRINRRIDEITASNLSLRLPEVANGDELTHLAQRFNRMLTRLEEAFRLQRSFVAQASHELRTPLTAITGQLEVSLLADDEPAELRATLHSVLDDVRGLNQMVNGLLALAKANMDASAVPMELVRLDTLLEQVRLDLKRLQPDYTSSLTISPPDADPARWQRMGSASLLRTALFNLLENGGKFSTDQRVSVTLLTQSTSLLIRVHNMGQTIPTDQLAAIFSPFQRGRNASGKPGNGIGLALVDRIIRLHQGTLQVESSDEAGTTFTVTLPR